MKTVLGIAVLSVILGCGSSMTAATREPAAKGPAVKGSAAKEPVGPTQFKAWGLRVETNATGAIENMFVEYTTNKVAIRHLVILNKTSYNMKNMIKMDRQLVDFEGQVVEVNSQSCVRVKGAIKPSEGYSLSKVILHISDETKFGWLPWVSKPGMGTYWIKGGRPPSDAEKEELRKLDGNPVDIEGYFAPGAGACDIILTGAIRDSKTKKVIFDGRVSEQE